MRYALDCSGVVARSTATPNQCDTATLANSQYRCALVSVLTPETTRAQTCRAYTCTCHHTYRTALFDKHPETEVSSFSPLALLLLLLPLLPFLLLPTLLPVYLLTCRETEPPPPAPPSGDQKAIPSARTLGAAGGLRFLRRPDPGAAAATDAK